MVDWRNAPWPLRTYVVIALAGAVIGAIFVSGPVAPRAFLVALTAVICFFLLRRVRWLWIVTIVFIPLDFVVGILEGSLRWYAVPIGLVSLTLLLLPDTRRFFEREALPAEV